MRDDVPQRYEEADAETSLGAERTYNLPSITFTTYVWVCSLLGGWGRLGSRDRKVRRMSPFARKKLWYINLPPYQKESPLRSYHGRTLLS